MSNVSNRHNVFAFTAGKSEALTGQRLSRVGYKKTKENPNPPQSICASIPRITDEMILENVQKILPVIREALEGLQDGIMRSLYESKDCSLEKFTSVSDEELSIGACAAFFSSQASGGKITKEYLEQWFKNEMGDLLTVAIAERIGTEDAEDKRIVQALNGYRDMFSSLSGTKTLLGAGQITQIRKILELCDVSETEVGKWAVKRLDEMDTKNANLTALF
jgi:hypothetical protein